MKLEVGKTYVMRDKSHVTILKESKNTGFPMRGTSNHGTLAFTKEGKYTSYSTDHQFDIISEYMTLDLNKPLQTLDGTPVILITTNARGNYPLLGYVGESYDLQRWNSKGKHSTYQEYDLVNTPEEVWANVYQDYTLRVWINTARYKSEKDAKENADKCSKSIQINITDLLK